MKPVEIIGYDYIMKPPSDWNEQRLGKCDTLYVRSVTEPNGLVILYSAWMPSTIDLFKLNNGNPLLLGIIGNQHPPVCLMVGERGDVPRHALLRKPNIIDVKPKVVKG